MLLRYPITVLVYLIPAILISLTFHEFCHALASYKLGDRTARDLGRLSINPLKHLDVLGTIMMLFSGFGWAKPVPINPMYYRDKRKGILLVSLAGPLSNVILAMIIALPMVYLEIKHGLQHGGFYQVMDTRAILYNLCFIIYTININLAVFNIIPVPPLDGSKILSVILPQQYYFKLVRYENFIGLAFLVIIFVVPSALWKIMSPFIWVIETAINYIISPIVRIFV